MGKRYGEDGQAQARAVMADLAASPHTARHLSTKIARHFVADDPPPALVDRLTKAYLRQRRAAGRGRRHPDPLARGLGSAGEPSSRRPMSSWSRPGAPPTRRPPTWRQVAKTLNEMGQKPFSAPSPKGWPEEAPAWCAPDAVIKRMTWSEGFAQVASAIATRCSWPTTPSAPGSRPWPPRPSPAPRPGPRRVAILLMSPEFQRR